MYITAARELRTQPRDMALLPTGELLVFSGSATARHLEAYDSDLELLWNQDFHKQTLDMHIDERGLAWVLDPSGASAFNGRGRQEARIDAAKLDGMEVAGLAFVGDDLLFAYQHVPFAKPDHPALARLRRDGSARWSARLRSDRVTFSGRGSDHSTIDDSGRLRPETWVCGYFGAGDLTISDDVVFAVYSDMPRSGLGIGYAASVADGTLRYTTRCGPIDNVAARDPGGFLVGYMGYGAFETVLYDQSGNERTRWDSQGFYVIADDEIRVIEMENRIPSRCRLARLLGDGEVVRGDLLDGFHTSRPYLHDDGTIYFARAGMMIAVRDLMIQERVFIRGKPDEDMFYTRTIAAGTHLLSTYSINAIVDSKSLSERARHVSGLVRIEI